MTPIEATFLESELDTAAAVHYKPSVDRNTQMSRHKAVEQHDDEKVKHDWKEKVQLSDIYAGYSKQLPDMLTKIQSMWDGQLG